MSRRFGRGGQLPIVSAHRRQQIFITVGLVALAFNLRPTAVAVGPVLSDVRAALGMSPTTAGVVTTLPVLSFAAFGAAAPWCARAIGVHRVMVGSLILTATGLAARSAADSAGVFILATLVALAGMAVANVLLPSLVKQHFPHRIGLITSIYTTALAIGLTAASGLTVPVADAFGSWRGGLAIWAATAVLAALPWLGLVRHDVRPDDAASRGAISFREVARTRLGWEMAVFFGAQSMQAYAIFGWLPEIFQAAGFSARTAGLLLALTTAVSIPVSFVLPGVAVRIHNQAPMIVTLCSSYVVGYLGLALWPVGGAVAWALLIGVGTGIFPLVLTLIGLRSRTPDGTAALSGFTQGVGYLIAAVGPFMMGAVYDATHEWTLPLMILVVLVIPQVIAGVLVSKPRFLEDQLPPSPSG